MINSLSAMGEESAREFLGKLLVEQRTPKIDSNI